MRASSIRGAVAHLSGMAAEDAVARRYAASGHAVVARRWRGLGGEIDLILRRGTEIVFVEVKKGRSAAGAAERLSQRQIGRLMAAAAEFLGGEPEGQDTQARFDVALMDATGAITVIENALGP